MSSKNGIFLYMNCDPPRCIVIEYAGVSDLSKYKVHFYCLHGSMAIYGKYVRRQLDQNRKATRFVFFTRFPQGPAALTVTSQESEPHVTVPTTTISTGGQQEAGSRQPQYTSFRHSDKRKAGS